MNQSFLENGWPSVECRLLLQALFCTPKKALVSWRKWEKTYDIDTASWAEVRILAALQEKIEALDPHSTLIPRLKGIRRFVWTKNHLRISQSLPAIDLLLNHNIPVMILKGGARILSNLDQMGSRYVRDFDLFIPKEHIAKANNLLLDHYYRPQTGKLPGKVRSVAFDRVYAPDTTDDDDCEIDIHRSVLRYGRSADFDQALWERAHTIHYRGRSITIPSPSDQWIITVAHGMVSDSERPADWVMDSILATKEPGFCWKKVFNEAKRRKILVPVSAAVSYFTEQLDQLIPEEFLSCLESKRQPWIYRQEFLSDSCPRTERSFIQRMLSGFAEWQRSRNNRRKDQVCSRAYLARPALFSYEQAIKIKEQPLHTFYPKRKNLVLDIALSSPPKERIQYDLLIEGKWSARLRIRPQRLLPQKGGLLWRFHIPINAQNKQVQVVRLDEKFQPTIPIAKINGQGKKKDLLTPAY